MYSRKLNIFIEVAKAGSFNKAARILYISPTAVMKQIDQLEDLLDFPLFTRTSQGVALTEAGRSLYQDGLAIMAQTDQAISRARHIANRSPFTIRLGRSFLNNGADFFHLWNRFTQVHPGFSLEIVPFEDDHLRILNTIQQLGKDFDIIFGPCDSEEWLRYVRVLEKGQARLTCAVSKTHPLSRRKVIDLDDLANQKLVMVKAGHSASNDALRAHINKTHPAITILDAEDYYDLDVFNKCNQAEVVLLSLDIWSNIHPSLINIPLNWQGPGVPYGLIYAKQPREEVLQFIDDFSKLV
ncbi:LysR family transcriptional regulator [Peptococcus simiae]|uniref:LysR family transcriptional regulator n=1 Tax=Peptococcus simiae TaxID=1643805 RepID=A0ABW9GY61_9FIRM